MDSEAVITETIIVRIVSPWLISGSPDIGRTSRLLSLGSTSSSVVIRMGEPRWKSSIQTIVGCLMIRASMIVCRISPIRED